MATRLGFRTRPVDVTRELALVLDEIDLDTEDTNREHNGSSEKGSPEKEKKPAFIPVPPVTEVATYAIDYLPVHKVPVTYLKAPRDKKDVWEVESLEYDLDLEDTQLLRDINQDGTQDRLRSKQLETMLWHLEVRNAEATECSLQMAGTNATERSNAAAMASTEHLTKNAALEMLLDCCDCQQYIMNRVYDYWKEKRKRLNRPNLRRLQAPTPETDANPYLVFRQRAKPSKLQTRRRRETQEESLEKVHQIYENVAQAVKLAELTHIREINKAVLQNNYVDRHQYLLRTILRERPQEELDKRLATAVKFGFKERQLEPVSLPKPGERIKGSGMKRSRLGPPVAVDESRKANAKKPQKRAAAATNKRDALIGMPLPPAEVRPCMPFVEESFDGLHREVEADELGDWVSKGLESGSLRCRVGRAKRLILDQADEDSTSTHGDGAGNSNGSDWAEDEDHLFRKLNRLLAM